MEGACPIYKFWFLINFQRLLQLKKGHITIVHINPFSIYENYYPAITCLDNHKLKTIEAGVMTYKEEKGKLRSGDFS